MTNREGWTIELGFKEALFLAVSDLGLVANFAHSIGVPGREDPDSNPGLVTAGQIIDLLRLVVWSRGKDQYAVQQIADLYRRRWWILLCDCMISGSSAKNELEKLIPLQRLVAELPGSICLESSPRIVLCAQVVTDQALATLGDLIPLENIHYGIRFSDRFRISSPECALFGSPQQLTEVREFCEWFGDTYFLNYTDGPFRRRLEFNLEKGGKPNYAFGWRNGGYTIVTQDNALSNSVPCLSYAHDNSRRPWAPEYAPPFPRTESRVTHALPQDMAKIEFLRSTANSAIIKRALGARCRS